MAILKCRMCGGNLEITDISQEVCSCEYCGSKMTMPNGITEQKIELLNRANHYRMANEFDKAALVYESILEKDSKEAEAYYGLCLCIYGIEYVVDPKTQRRVPTCHRTVLKSILQNENYKLALEYAGVGARYVYQQEAAYIDNVQKQILAISAQNEPMDIFISYKETDVQGNRTEDSVLAQECYNVLTKEGYKVFFSRISLSEHIGESYEPYIFSALDSAKIMLVVTTSVENVNSVWVKNEWSRYLKMAEESKDKKLIVGYKNVSPYDLPIEFGGIQSLNLGNLGYTQDLVMGVKKLLGQNKSKEENKPSSTLEVNSRKMLENGETFINLGDWEAAYNAFKEASTLDPGNWKGWWGVYRSQNFNLEVAAETGKGKFNYSLDETPYLNAIQVAPADEKENMTQQHTQYMAQRKQFLAVRKEAYTEEKEQEEKNIARLNDDLEENIQKEKEHNKKINELQTKKNDAKSHIDKDAENILKIICKAIIIEAKGFIPMMIIFFLIAARGLSGFDWMYDSVAGFVFFMGIPAWTSLIISFSSAYSNNKSKECIEECEQEISRLVELRSEVQKKKTTCLQKMDYSKGRIKVCNNELDRINKLTN